MKKIALLFIGLSLVVFSANAQKFGVKAGIDLSTVSTDFYDASSVLGFNGSVFFQKTLIPMISMRPELGFYQKGHHADLGVEFDTKMNYAQLDLDFRVKPPIIPLYVFAGPYASYAVSGTIYNNLTETSSDITFDKDHYLPYDFGLSAGIGFSQKITLMTVFAEVKYEIGALDIYGYSSNNYMKNRNIMISVGFMLGL